jgi:hypothetical protein
MVLLLISLVGKMMWVSMSWVLVWFHMLQD